MKKVKLITIILGIFFLSTACKKNSDDKISPTPNTSDIKIVNGRLSFKDLETFRSTLKSLVNNSESSLDKWEDQLGFKSLRRSESSAYDSFGFPKFYSSIINRAGEYMIGDTIYWFNNGLKHVISNKDEGMLANIKKNPSLSKIHYEAGSTIIPTQQTNDGDNNSIMIKSVTLGEDEISAPYQKEYNRDDNNKVRKMVFEIANYVDKQGYAYYSWLFVHLKLEDKDGHHWKYPKDVLYEKGIKDLSYMLGLKSTFDGSTLYKSGSYTSIPLAEFGPFDPNIPQYRLQTDNKILEYVIAEGVSASKTVTASVQGKFHLKVLSPGNSNGIYDVNAVW